MKYSGIGGQAVLEGVMMKNQKEYAVAVRKPDGEIEVKKDACESLRDKSKVANLPIIRGVVTFVESLKTGMKTLNYSTSFYEEEEKEREEKELTEEEKKKKDKEDSFVMGLVMVFAVLIAVGIFVVGPFLLSEVLKKPIPSPQLRGLIEGVLRVLLFVGYVKLISLMKDIKRTFMYHGAEHKSIYCYEHGDELTVENVKKYTRLHPRCGTSFLFIVMIITMI